MVCTPHSCMRCQKKSPTVWLMIRLCSLLPCPHKRNRRGAVALQVSRSKENGEAEATFANEPRWLPPRLADESRTELSTNGKGRRHHRIERWCGSRDCARICQTRLQRRPHRARPGKAGRDGG